MKMDDQNVRRIVREEIFRSNNSSRFSGVDSISDHVHNGVDSPKVSELNIINGIRNGSLIIMNQTEVFRIKNVQNVKRLTFNGYAANNVSGPASIRAMISGEAVFGTCYQLSGEGEVISPNTNVTAVPFIQGCSSMTVTNPAIQRVAADSRYFAYAVDGNGVDVAKAYVIDVSTSDITIKVELSGSWQITGSLILS